jgi:hypothetical protein
MDQQVTAFVQKFQSAGVNEVIVVGSSSGTWPVALTNTQSSYNPPVDRNLGGDSVGHA